MLFCGRNPDEKEGEVRGRFANANSETAEAEVATVRRRLEYRAQRRQLALTDGLLGKLERLNLKGQERLDDVTRRQIGRVMSQLPPPTRLRLRTSRTVQQALDGVFDVQAELLAPLQRAMSWDPALALEDDEPKPLAQQSA
jgi:hypothetical protein